MRDKRRSVWVVCNDEGIVAGVFDYKDEAQANATSLTAATKKEHRSVMCKMPFNTKLETLREQADHVTVEDAQLILRLDSGKAIRARRALKKKRAGAVNVRLDRRATICEKCGAVLLARNTSRHNSQCNGRGGKTQLVLRADGGKKPPPRASSVSGRRAKKKKRGTTARLDEMIICVKCGVELCVRNISRHNHRCKGRRGE